MGLLYGVTDIDLSGVEVGVPVEFTVADHAEGFDRLGQALGPALVGLVLDDAVPRMEGIGVVALGGEDVDAIRLVLAPPRSGVERVDGDMADAHVAALHSFEDLGL